MLNRDEMISAIARLESELAQLKADCANLKADAFNKIADDEGVIRLLRARIVELSSALDAYQGHNRVRNDTESKLFDMAAEALDGGE